jgi:hypothetical protein
VLVGRHIPRWSALAAALVLAGIGLAASIAIAARAARVRWYLPGLLVMLALA